MKPTFTVRGGNHILAGLPAEEYDHIAPHLRRVPLRLKDTLYDEGPITSVYFVEEGVVSLVTMMEDGAVVENCTVGNEGMVGLQAFLGVPEFPGTAICQIPGRAMAMPVAALVAERERLHMLARFIMRYTSATIAMLAQGVACNRAHSVEERMARWLLMTHDRVTGDEFPLTQEFLSQMLGVRRPSVNLAGIALQRAGLIRYSRGRITVVDRAGLESAACECYAHTRRQFDLALGNTIGD